mgnify:CR=1 FL=1
MTKIFKLFIFIPLFLILLSSLSLAQESPGKTFDETPTLEIIKKIILEEPTIIETEEQTI